ncbi:MAG: hypothetical protein M1839_003889 [Geoglossum umbratile]|nr:MAG: hypothetical protein M1839_003889 [Geoglossum umbratile]
MGQRHNNRRRSRPRGRGQHKVDPRPDVHEAREILSDIDFAVGILPGEYRMNQARMQRLDEERQREADWLAEEQQRMFGGEIGDEDLARLGLLYENPQDHDRHNTLTTEVEPEDMPTPAFRTRSPSSDKRTRPPNSPKTDGGFSSSEEEWDVMSSTGSETNQSEAWEIVGDDI